MSEFRVLADLRSVLDGERRLPTVVMWNRLEGRPRRRDFSRALRAEVRDPLWMLTRQWQMGEFKGDDAGSPATAKLRYSCERVTHLKRREGAPVEYDEGRQPLDPEVEALPLPLSLGALPSGLDQRLAMGRRWAKLLRAEGFGPLVATFRGRHRFDRPNPEEEDEFPISAHAGVWQSFAAVADRAIDGGSLYAYLRTPGNQASSGLGLSEAEAEKLDELGERFLAWVRALYGDPAAGDSAWNPTHLEYQASLSAPRGGEGRTLVADQYHGGGLDWYAFDVAAEPDAAFPPADPARPEPTVTGFIPTGIRFEGMPSTRWWSFEEGRTNFGEVRPDTTDLAKLLLVEFGLLYANDWFLLPIELPVGSLTDVEGLAVTNVFGERYWVEPATSDADEGWRRWSMFEVASRGPGGADSALLLPSSAATTLEGDPREEVYLIRDEVSNMVWGIETIVQMADGSPRPGREAANELRGRYQSALDEELAASPPEPDPEPNAATIRYELMSTVPENWIPFVPMHVEGDNREVQLQRAAMPRLLKGARGGAAKGVEPRTVLLREGLDGETREPYFIAEEEVARAGEHLVRRWRRARWRDGRVFTWLAVQRRTGRGEGSSGLAFDLMKPKPPEQDAG